MKKKLILTLVLLTGLFFNSCSYNSLIPSHPTKDKSQYWVDKRICEKTIKSYSKDLNDIDGRYVAMDEMIHIRLCLKNKGWSY